jgi:flagella basal body P-ring formation protein FlgA
MQMLCRHFQPSRSHPAKRRKLSLWLCFVLSVAAPLPSAAQSNGLEDLQQKAKQWLGLTQGMATDVIQFAPMDARLKFEPCQRAIVFDHPFSNRQTLRARCEQPAWQHYLQVSNRGTLGGTVLPGSPQTVNRQVWVSSQLLKRGTVIQPGLLKATEMALPASESQVVQDIKDVSNMELLRDLPANTPLRSYDVKASLMVRRGQQVLVSVGEGKGFSITVRAEAQQDGLMGEQIRLKNTESGRSLSAVVTGFSTAKGL